MVRETRHHDWLTPQLDVSKEYFDDVTGDNWISFIKLCDAIRQTFITGCDVTLINDVVSGKQTFSD